MGKTIFHEVSVDIDVDDIIDEIETDDLIEELENRGYEVFVSRNVMPSIDCQSEYIVEDCNHTCQCK